MGPALPGRWIVPAIVSLFLIMFFPVPTGASIQTVPTGVEIAPEIAGELDLTFFERYWHELEREAGEYLPGLHWRNYFTVPGEEPLFLEPGRAIGGLARFLWGEVSLNFRVMGQLILLAVVAALLQNLETAFEREQVAALTRGIVFIVLLGVCLHSFYAALGVAARAVDNMVDFILAMLPVTLALLASLGSLASAAMLHPLIIFGVNFFGTVIREFIFPLIFLSTILALAGHFSPHFKVERLAGLLRDLSMWGLGLCMTVFTGFLVVQGAAGTFSDAVTLRTAKYMTGALVPVIGKMLADAVETVAGVSLVLKNSIYLAGTVILFVITVFPLLKLIALVAVYKVTAALVQPLGESNLGEAINTMGNCLLFLFASVAGVALIFIIAVTVIAGAGNAAVMLR